MTAENCKSSNPHRFDTAELKIFLIYNCYSYANHGVTIIFYRPIKMIKFSKIFGALAVAAFISGCVSNAPEIETYNAPRYQDSGVIELKVNKVDIVSEFIPEFERPHVEQLFPISIEKTARLWAKDRLDAVDFSSNKIASFIIKDASVTEEVEESGKLFYKDRLVYKANLNVVLKISDDLGTDSAQTEIVAWRELVIPADTDIIEKEKYWNGMVQKLFDEFNVKMEQNIHKYLNMYVANNNYIHTYDN